MFDRQIGCTELDLEGPEEEKARYTDKGSGIK